MFEEKRTEKNEINEEIYQKNACNDEHEDYHITSHPQLTSNIIDHSRFFSSSRRKKSLSLNVLPQYLHQMTSLNLQVWNSLVI